MLERAGLVRRGERRQVRGGTEQYFVRAARRLRTPAAAGPATPPRCCRRSPRRSTAPPRDALLNLRRIRLTRQQAASLAAHLERLVDELPEAGPREATHGVLVSVFQSGQARAR